MVKVRSDLFICIIISTLLCLAAYGCIVVLPDKLSKGKDTETAAGAPGEVGCEYVEGIKVLHTMDEILASDDVFVLPEDVMLMQYPSMKEDSEGYKWDTAIVDHILIPVKFNSYAKTDEYTPVGKLVKKPANGLEQVKDSWVHSDEKIIEDAYIDMDNGMEKVMADEKHKKSMDSVKTDHGEFKEKVTMILTFIGLILTFVLHAVGVKLGLLPPFFPKRQQ